MSDAIEAAAKAVDDLDWSQLEFGIGPESEDVAKAALLAALPHLTEGLAEVCRNSMRDAMNRYGPYSGRQQGDHIAAAVTAHLERQVKG